MAPTFSPDAHLLLPLIASQVPIPGCPVPTPLTLVDPQVWDTSTTVVVSHHQPVLVHCNGPSSFPPSFLLLKPTTEALGHYHPSFISGTFNSNQLTLQHHILPVHKHSSAHHLVQDLCLINDAVIPKKPGWLTTHITSFLTTPLQPPAWLSWT